MSPDRQSIKGEMFSLIRRYFIISGVALVCSMLGVYLLPANLLVVIIVPTLILMELTNRYLKKKQEVIMVKNIKEQSKLKCSNEVVIGKDNKWLSDAIEEAEGTIEFKMEGLLLDFTGLACLKMKEQEITISELATKAGLDFRCVLSILGCTHNISFEMMVRISKVLNIEITFK